MATKLSEQAKSLSSRAVQWDGRVITKPGIYKDVPLDLYHSAELFDGVPSLSSSGLRTIISRSPAHYWATSPYNPDRIVDEDEEEKKHFVMGRALHHLVYGQPHFQKLFKIRPEKIADPGESIAKPWHGNRTVCKEFLAAMREQGISVLTPEDAEQLKGMALSLGKNTAVQAGILAGEVEYSWFWRDPKTGIWIKWRPDSAPVDSMDFVDLKSTTDVRYFKLMNVLADRGYYQQGALGAEACRQLLKREMTSFSLLWIEKKNPWCTALQVIKPDLIKRGEKLNRFAIDTFWKCWTEKHWPGPAEDDIGFIEVSERETALIDEKIARLAS